MTHDMPASTALVEYILFFSLVLVGVAALAWVLCYQALGRRLKARGLGPKPGYSGRVNSMDAFFGRLKFLLCSEDRGLGDSAITRICLAVKVCTFLMILGFLVMVLGPMAIH